ncbi:hypothetical protein [Absidia glauca]|uniref:Uncharacterized protein n=1 Tax=Absidia glauca TaxID=4829 RepID=A0A163JAX7_ABSGL|nr:hypothetical protein [Absidia glauca]
MHPYVNHPSIRQSSIHTSIIHPYINHPSIHQSSINQLRSYPQVLSINEGILINSWSPLVLPRIAAGNRVTVS